MVDAIERSARHGLCEAFTMLILILGILLVVSLAGGGWGHSRYGYSGWSPAALILIVVLVLYFTGNLRMT